MNGIGATFVVAEFQAWKEEHTRADREYMRAEKLQARLDARGESELQKNLEAAQAQGVALQEKIAPRRIPDEKKATITKELAKELAALGPTSPVVWLSSLLPVFMVRTTSPCPSR